MKSALIIFANPNPNPNPASFPPSRRARSPSERRGSPMPVRLSRMRPNGLFDTDAQVRPRGKPHFYSLCAGQVRR